jgi:hypothetical protein
MNPEQPKTCVTCIHLLGKRTNIEDAETKWRCVHPANVLPSDTNLVTGVVTRQYVEENIFEVRGINGSCGIDGTQWEQYIPPAGYDVEKLVAITTPTLPKPESKSPTLDRLKKLKVNLSDL